MQDDFDKSTIRKTHFCGYMRF